MTEIAVLLWMALAGAVSYFADKKGHSAVGYFFLSLLLSPIIGFLIALIATDKSEFVKVRDGAQRKCPFCAELVKAEAIKCKHCGSSIVDTKGAEYLDEKKLNDLINKIQSQKRG